jgi:hypothetical protein
MNRPSRTSQYDHSGRSLVLVGGTSQPPKAAPIVHVVGARPNFVKMAPVIAALEAHRSVEQIVVHTGQHYDRRMSEEILCDLDFPAPDRFLGVGSGAHGEQTAKVLAEMERVLMEVEPVAVLVAGDVNSTLAAALAASKLGIPIAHLESGLRSGDWSMPEEINRVLTDRLSDLLFTHSPEAESNLAAEGIEGTRRVRTRIVSASTQAPGAARSTLPATTETSTPRRASSTTWCHAVVPMPLVPSRVGNEKRTRGRSFILTNLTARACEGPSRASSQRAGAQRGRGSQLDHRRAPRTGGRPTLAAWCKRHRH